MVCICVDDREAALKIVEIVHEEFPQVRTCVRAYDRIHAIDLMKLEVDYQMRETFESALAFGQATLEELGLDPAEAAAVTRRRAPARRRPPRDAEVGGHHGRRRLLHGTRLEPEPLIAPKARSHGLSARDARHHRRGRARRCLTRRDPAARRLRNSPRFVAGSTMRHVW